MRYASISYNYSPDFTSAESWFKRTEGYWGILESLSRENEVINIKQIDYEGNCHFHGIDYRFVDFGKRKTYFPLRLNSCIKNLRPDIVIVQGLHHPLQLIQLRLLLNKSARIIVHHHAEVPFTGFKKYIQQLADKCTDAYLFASMQMGIEWVNKGNIADERKIHEVMEVSSIFYPIKKAAAKLKTGASGSQIFLWVGRLNENKDPLNVVSAFLKYAAINADARLYMAYHTDELLGAVKQLLDKSPAKNTVILTGKVPRADMLYWFNSADFFISGSHYEGSGTALCEAMSCGCVPIVTDIDSFRMITDNGNCGLLYEAGNSDALLSALVSTKNIDIIAKQNAALAYFKSNLSFDAIASKIQATAEALR